MNLSYWEYNSWLSNLDFTVVGSGIVGLTTAIAIKKRYPKAKVLVLEKGILPQGASTKNAGFACFGSISEILSDLSTHTEKEVIQLVQERYEGIRLLRKMLGDKQIEFMLFGGHEVFLEKDRALYEKCLEKRLSINRLLRPIFRGDAFQLHENNYGFQNILPRYITHEFEGQLNTGMMVKALLKKAREKDITILNGLAVEQYSEGVHGVHVKTNEFEFKTSKLMIATNGFATQLLKEAVQPARAQVIITRPIKNLAIKGTFHFDEGYYYFRNIDNRILFGGGRNLDFKTENTTQFGSTEVIQNQLEHLLETMILPKTKFEIEARWSGIMGVGQQKRPIIKQVSENVFCGIRLGGMGIAIGSLVGNKMAQLVS